MIAFVQPLRALIERRLRRPSGFILLYHRVRERGLDPQLLGVSPEVFQSQLAVLAQTYEPASLDQLIGDEPGAKPRFAVTFDDGYRDNFDIAAPIAQRLGVPLTLFVTSGARDDPYTFYWDYLQQVILCAPSLDHLERSVVVPLVGAANFAQLRDAGPVPETWNVLSRSTEGPRELLYREACARLERLPFADRRRFLQSLGQPHTGSTAHLSNLIDLPSLRRLPSHITIGAHTVSHPTLSVESIEVQSHELVESKRALEAASGQPVAHLAYPFGGRTHVSANTRALVARLGYRTACMNIPGVVSSTTDRLAMPRFLVRDEAPASLLQRISRWTRGI